MCGSEHTLGGPKNYRKLNSFSKIAELKHALMRNCTTFSVSRLFYRFFTARSGSTRFYKALPNKISSVGASKYIDFLMHFAERLNLSQVKDSDTQIYTMRFFNVEIYPILIDWWRVHAILLLC